MRWLTQKSGERFGLKSVPSRMLMHEAVVIKKLLKGGKTRFAGVSASGAARASARWGAVGFLYFEAGVSIWAGAKAYNEPLIEDSE